MSSAPAVAPATACIGPADPWAAGTASANSHWPSWRSPADSTARAPRRSSRPPAAPIPMRTACRDFRPAPGRAAPANRRAGLADARVAGVRKAARAQASRCPVRAAVRSASGSRWPTPATESRCARRSAEPIDPDSPPAARPAARIRQRPARTPTPMPKHIALLKWLVKLLEMAILRFDSACVCEQSYPYLLRDSHPSGVASGVGELNSQTEFAN